MDAQLSLKNLMPISLEDIARQVRTIHDFPKPGIAFKDISPLLANPVAFDALMERLVHSIKKSRADCIVGLDARGFIFGSVAAHMLGLPFVPARKPGKLPAETVEVSYELEYGQATLQVHRDSLKSGQRVAVVDDLLATGGTAAAAGKLVEELGATVAGYFFAIEIADLGGSARLTSAPVTSILRF